MDPQKQLKFDTSYPLRPKFFFAHAIRIMSHYAVAQDVGLLGFAILIEVVLTEDKRGYTSAPTFWQRSFQDRFGRGKEAVSEAIGKCVDHGWLHWDQPQNNRAATAWITFPAWVDEAVINRGWSDFPPNNPPNNPPNHPPENPPNNPPYSSLPFPEPIQPDDGWEAVSAAMSEIGICETSKPLRRLQENKVPIDLALGVLRYASEAKGWKPAKVRCRLMQLKPGQDPKDERLWMQRDYGSARPTVSLYNGPSEEARARDSRLRQLELDFDLKSKTVEEVVTTFNLPDALRIRLQPYASTKWDYVRNDNLRLDVLTELASRASNN